MFQHQQEIIAITELTKKSDELTALLLGDEYFTPYQKSLIQNAREEYKKNEGENQKNDKDDEDLAAVLITLAFLSGVKDPLLKGLRYGSKVIKHLYIMHLLEKKNPPIDDIVPLLKKNPFATSQQIKEAEQKIIEAKEIIKMKEESYETAIEAPSSSITTDLTPPLSNLGLIEEIQRLEIFPGRPYFIPVVYKIDGPQEIPTTNPHMAGILDKYHQFEYLNKQVLTLLNKPNLTISDFDQTIAKMRAMVLLYLQFFKSFPVNQSVEEAAGFPSDLAGGRAIAQIFLRLEGQLRGMVAEANPNATGGAPLSERVVNELRRFDDKKSAILISKPAENFNQQQMDSISFGDLINIVHQKGRRNFPSVLHNIKGQESTLQITLTSSSGNSNQEVVLDVGASKLKVKKGKVSKISVKPPQSPHLSPELGKMIIKEFNALYPEIIRGAKEGDEESLIALGVVFSRLTEIQQKKVMEIIIANLTGKSSSAAWEAMGLIYPSLPELTKLEYFGNDLEGPVFKSATPGSYEAIVQYVRNSISESSQSEQDIIDYLFTKIEKDSKGALKALSEIITPGNQNVARFDEYLLWRMSKVKESQVADNELLIALAHYKSGLEFDIKKNQFLKENKSLYPTQWILYYEVQKKPLYNKFLSELNKPQTDEFFSVSFPLLAQLFFIAKAHADEEVQAALYRELEFHLVDGAPGAVKALALLRAATDNSKKSSKKKDDSAMAVSSNVEIKYHDVRSNPTTTVPLPMRYIARAFALGQLVHQQANLFSPERASIVVDDRTAIIGLPLGAHSASIQLTLGPLEQGGGLTIHYTDSGASYAPGSDRRIAALEKAFALSGFNVKRQGYVLEASFDKEIKSNGIDELPQRLQFAISVLTSTLDLDLRINNGSLKK